jgi:hypothetical protein
MKINMVALGKAVRNAAISGHREITKPMRKTPSTGRDIEGGGQRGLNPGHKNRSLEATFRHPNFALASSVNSQNVKIELTFRTPLEAIDVFSQEHF